MKTIVLFILIFLANVANAQDSINPYVIQQKCNIVLQKTDVYYRPMAPPWPTDTRTALSSQGNRILDSNGVWQDQWDYKPVYHDTTLDSTRPCGIVLGTYAYWQRLFQAMNKPDGSPSDIVAGDTIPNDTYFRDTGSVIISKNEDVDFRATGTIRFEPGVHGMPGAFVHAYIEPKYDSIVFSDEFNGAAIDTTNWYVSNKRWGDGYTLGEECYYDTNVRTVADPDAHDGHALDIFCYEDTNYCFTQGFSLADTCYGSPLILKDGNHKFLFHSAEGRTCPFPYTSREAPLGQPWYNEAPYGKFEVREKIPHIPHHTNFWGGGAYEWDASETDNGDGNQRQEHPNIGHHFRFGPYLGIFRKSGSNVYFISPSAQWSTVNNPTQLLIGNFCYNVQMIGSSHATDTVVPTWDQNHNFSGFPPSVVADSIDSIPFYYQRSSQNVAYSMPSKVATDAYGRWRILKVPYRIVGTDTSWFWKGYQPTSITFTTLPHPYNQQTFNCFWDSSLNNSGDTGRLWLEDTLIPPDTVSTTDSISYSIPDLYAGGFSYLIPPMNVNIDLDTGLAETDTTPYQYHTFGMEIFPSEIRFLVDSVVVRRIPDRLIPRGDPYYDWAWTTPRSPIDIHLPELDLDFSTYTNASGATVTDTLGQDSSTSTYKGVTYYNSIAYAIRSYFEHHGDSCEGCWDVEEPPGSGRWLHAAHHLVDYIKVWDVPADVQIPKYPATGGP